MTQSCRLSSETFLPFSDGLECIAEMTTKWRPAKRETTAVAGRSITMTGSSKVLYEYTLRNNKTDGIDLYVFHESELWYELDLASVLVSPKEGTVEQRVDIRKNSCAHTTYWP